MVLGRRLVCPGAVSSFSLGPGKWFYAGGLSAQVRCPHFHWGLENGSRQEACLPRCGVRAAVEIHVGTSAPQEKNHSAKPVMASGSA